MVPMYLSTQQRTPLNYLERLLRVERLWPTLGWHTPPNLESQVRLLFAVTRKGLPRWLLGLLLKDSGFMELSIDDASE